MNRTLTTALVAGAFAAPATANHVDFITDGTFMISGPGSTVVEGDSANILGGFRSVGLDTVTPGDSLAEKLDGNDYISFDNTNGAAGVLNLDYGDFVGGGGALNSDFASDWSFIAVTINDATGMGALSLSLESSAGAGSSASQVVDSAGTYYFGFDEVGFSLVDFGDIDRVTVELAADADADFEIGSITRESVPAPAGLAALGLAGLAGARRRR